MTKTYTKRLFLLAVFTLFILADALAQTITVGTVDPGPYGQGSSIAVPVSVNDAASCITQANTFNLYLSDASGNFAPGTLIGSYSGFYATFVNGIIPAGTPAGAGYKVEVKSTSPVVTSSVSAAFTISGSPGVTPSLTSTETVAPNVFGRCVGSTSPYTFFPGPGTVTASFYHEGPVTTGYEASNVSIPAGGYSFTPTLGNYTITTKSVNAGIVGTHDYQLVNNQVVNPFSPFGQPFVCLPPGGGSGILTFDLPASGPGSIAINYPGTVYTVNWGDGTNSSFTYCQIVALGSFLTHTYTLPTCGNTNNALNVTGNAVSPYCGAIASPVTTSAKVIITPTLAFALPATACANTAITVANNSDPGPDYSAGVTSTCTSKNPNALYNWYFDGTLVASNVPLSYSYIITAAQATPGPHSLLLHAVAPGGAGAYCQASDLSRSICFEKKPTPAFTIPSPVCITSMPVTVTNTSTVDNTCSGPTYTWTAAPATFTFAGGTNKNSIQPQFNFTAAGTYTVTLSIASTCGAQTAQKTIVVQAAPTAALSANVSFCGKNQTLTFDATAGSSTMTTLSGTPATDTYAWTVTPALGGATYSFAGGTTASSQYPQITFTAYDTYTVKVSHTNSCGTITATQQLTFIQPPLLSAGSPQTVCASPTPTVTLAGVASGAISSHLWSSAGGGTFSDVTSLTSTYTPSTAEITAGSATLTLTATSTSPCNTITSQVVITITPIAKVTSLPTAPICSGSPLNYTITANLPGTTFTWTSVLTSGTATGFTASGSGNTITDVLLNTTTSDAVVTYTILPTYNSCPGIPFTLKVTVHPLPVMTASAPSPVCSNVAGNGTVALSSNVAGTTYTWTSTASAGITGNTNQVTPLLTSSINNTLSNSALTAGTVTYTITPYNGTCAGTPATVNIIVEPTPMTPNAGSDAEICASTTYTLSGNSPAPGTGLWTVSSGPAGTSFSNATSPTATVSGMIPGSVYQFTWTITGSPLCPSKSDIVIITVDKSPIGGTTSSPATVCSGSNSGTITLASQFGTVVRWESSVNSGGSWQPIVNTGTTQPYLNLTQTTLYRAVLHNGVCPDVTSAATTITVLPLPVVSNAGADDEICASTSYTLNGNNPSPGTGLWTYVSGPAGWSFSNATSPTATVSGLTLGGTYQFKWTITSSGTCPTSSDVVNITVDKSPVGGTTSTAATVCSGSNSGTITLASQFGTVARWESSINSGGSWQPIANTGITQPYLNLTQTTMYRAVLHNGVCPDVTSAPTTITVQPLPVTSNPGPDIEVCASTSYTLQGNNPSPGTGLWTYVSGPAGSSFSNNTSPTATVSGLIPGNIYQFKWTITGSPSCLPSSNVVNITIDKSPVGGTTSSPVTVCIGTNGGQVTLAGQFGTITRWESSINNGANWLPIANTSTIQPYLNLTQTTEYRAIVHNGICPDVPSAPTTITVVPLPVTSNAGPNDEVCSVTSYTLHGNNPAPGTGKWTVTGPAGVTFSDATNPNAIANGLIPGVYQFTWTITGSPACPPSSSTVTITIDKAPVGGTTSSNATVCISGNAGQITLSGQFGSIVRWESSINNGVTWLPIVNTSTAQSYLNLTQTTQYRAILHNSTTCADVPSSVATITVAPLPIPAIAGANDEVCNVTSYALHGNNPAPGTGLWTVTGPAGVTFSDATNPNAIANGLIPGSIYQFTWTITTSPTCPSTTSTVTITIDKAPVGGIVTANPAEVCYGSNGGTLTLTGQFGTIFRWESSIDNGATWQAISNGSATQTFTNLSQTTQYRAILHNSNTCSDVASAPATVTVDPLPVASNPGPNDEVCNVTTYTLHGNSPSPGTGKWTITQGPAGATFSDATNPNPIVSGLIPGNVYQFKWTITSSATSVCPPNSNTVNITIDQAPIGGTTSSPAEVCATGNGGQIKLTGQLGVVVRWESSVNGGPWQPLSNTGTTQSYLNLTQTTSYRAVLHNGATCSDVTSTATTITVDPPPVDADAGSDDEVCSVTSYILNGNSPVPGTGKWTVITGPAGVTFSDATNPAATVSGLIPGNVYQFRWTISGSPFCAPSTDIVTIKIDKAPIGGTTSAPAEVCSGGNGGQLKLTGQFGNIVRWESSIDNGVTWQPIANASSTQSYLNLTQTTQYRAVLHNSATCTDVTSTATTITVDPPPTIANAGTDDEVCSVTSYKLNGNSPAPGTGKWTVVTAPAPVTFSDATNPAAIVSGLIPGNVYQFRWTITGSPFCAPSTDMVTVTIDKAPIGGTTSTPAEVCSGANGGQIRLAGQFGSILRWESSIDNGATWQPIANNSTTQSYQNLTQTTQYRAVLHNSTTCADVVSTATTITVDAPPTVADAGTDDEVCSVTSYKLNGNSAAPGTGKWTEVTGPVGVTFSDATNPAAIVSGLIPGNVYQFRWSITGSAFCPPSTDIVTVTIDKAPIGGTTSAPAEVCSGSNSGKITLAGQFGTIARWESSIDNGTTWQPIANNITSQLYLNLTQTTQYRAILHNGNICTDVASTATTITVDTPPTIANAGAGDEVCNVTTYTLHGNTPAYGTGLWTTVTGPAGVAFSDATNPKAILTGLIPGNVYQFKWTIKGTASCPPSSSIVTIAIDLPPVGGTTSSPAEVCAGSNGGQIKLTGQFGNILRWESSINNGATWQPIANTNNTQSYINLTQTTQYRAVLHNSASCPDVTSTVTTITVDPPPVAADAGADDKVCSVTAYTLNGNNPGAGTGNWTVVGGPAGATFSDATKPNAIVSGLIPGNVYQFQWSITGTAACPPSTDVVTITIDKAPIGGTTSTPAEVCSGSNGGQITLSGQFGTVVRWESSINNGVTWQPIANTNLTQLYLNLTRTTTYRAILHNSTTCADVASTSTTITVDPPPVSADAGSDDEVCSVTTYILNGNNPSPGTGKWSVVGGPAGVTFSDVTNPAAIVSGLIPGSTYQFQWSITGTAACPPSTDIVTITIDKMPIGGTTSSPAEVCYGGNAGQIKLVGQFGSVLRWEFSTDNGTTWQAIANTGTTQPYINLIHTTQYRAILHNGATCSDVASTATTITVDPPPIDADAGPDDEVCSVISYNLHGNNPAPGTGKWTVVSGPAGATFSDATNPLATVSGLIPGNVYQFEWAITGTATCPPSTDIATIRVDKAPIGGTTSSPAEVCSGNNTGLITLSGQFGTIVQWEFSIDNGATWQPIANTSINLHYADLTQTTQFRAVLQNGSVCAEVASTATTITVDPPPVTSIPGPNDVVCNVTIYTLHANNPAPGTGKWTVVQGPAGAIFSDNTSPNATVSGLIPGNIYQFKWAITNTSACPPSSGVVTITVDQAPVGGTTSSAATVCWGSNSGQILLTGQFGTIVRWESSIDNGTTWQPIANSTATQSYSNLTRTTQFRAFLHNGTSCADVPSTPTIITVNPPTPMADAGQDYNICNQSAITLIGNDPGTFSGTWTQTAGPVVNIVNPSNYTTQVTGLSGDNTYTFQWTIYGLPPCGNSSSSINIGVHTDVVPSFTMNKSHGCGPTVVTFTNTTTPAPVGLFVWNFGDGTPTITAINPPPHTFQPSSDGTEKTYTITMTPASNCGSQAPFVDKITVSPQAPVAAILPVQTNACGTFTVTARNLSPGVNVKYDFYLVDENNAIVQHLSYPDIEDAIFLPIIPTKATIYTVYMIATDQCGNQSRTVPVNIAASPSLLVSAVQIKGGINSVCLGSPVTFQNISTGGDKATIIVYDSNKNPIATIPDGTADTEYIPPASGIYYVSLTAGNEGCGDAPVSALKEFTVYPVPKPSFTYTIDDQYNVTFTNTTPNAENIPAASLLYSWDFGDGSVKENAYEPSLHHFDFTKSPFTVALTATTPGTTCAGITTQVIEIKFHGNLFLPNAFIPSSSKKDLKVFMAKGFGLKTWHMQIFNNFGQMIWESTKLDSNGSPVEGWDGTYKGVLVEQGVYVWQISATLLNGQDWKGMSFGKEPPRAVGVIHLLK